MAAVASGRPAPRYAHRRRRVGHDRDARALGLRDVVDPARHDAGQEGEDGADVGVGAGVLHHLDPVPEDLPVTVAADRDVLHLRRDRGRGRACSPTGSRSSAPAGRAAGRPTPRGARPGSPSPSPRTPHRRRARRRGPARAQASRTLASELRTPWGACVEAWNSSRPSAATRAAEDRPSSGQGAIRWLTIRWRTTTSQPSKRLSSAPKSRRSATLVPSSGNRRTSSFASLVRVDDDGQRFVLDDHQLGRVRRPGCGSRSRWRRSARRRTARHPTRAGCGSCPG